MLPELEEIIRIFFPTPKNLESTRNVLEATIPPVVESAPVITIEPAPPPPGIVFDPNDLPNTVGRYSGDYDREIVLDLVDCLQKPPPQVTADYVTIVDRIGSFLGVSQKVMRSEDIFKSTGAKPMWDLSFFPEQSHFESSTKNVMSPSYFGSGPEAQEKLRNYVNASRNSVYEVVNRINSFVARAKNAGFVPPENPFSLAMTFNVGRMGFTPVNVANDQVTRIAGNIRTYIRLLDAERSGQLDLEKNVMHAAQLSSANMSLDGFGGTGNTAVDLAKLLPDADEIKAQKAVEALSVFDFTKRIPRVLFTAFYAPDGTPKGVIVGWKKVADASGYVVRRRNVFDGREVVYTFPNDDVKRSSNRLSEYVNAWILTFYDNIQSEFVYTILDSDIPPHGYFIYKVQAYQLQNDVPGSMFSVDTSPVFLSSIQKKQIRDQLEALDPDSGPDTISPYPIVSHSLLGDSRYDWLLAAVNIRQSINRSDSRTETRRYSYLAAQLDFLFTQADAGKFVVPKGRDVGQLLKNVQDSISKFGVNQVLREVLQETGALFHFEGKDPNDNLLFRSVDVGNPMTSGLISIVASAIDPETATMDLKTLSTNLPKLLSGEFVSTTVSLNNGSSQSSSKTARSGEIEFPEEFDKPSDSVAEEEIQFLQKFDAENTEGTVDLTTVEGISLFMRTIRIFSDIGPGRGSPIASDARVLVADPVKLFQPPPPPISSVQPIQPPSINTTVDSAGNVVSEQQRRDEAAERRAEAEKEKDDIEDWRKWRIGVKNDPTGRGRGGRGDP